MSRGQVKRWLYRHITVSYKDNPVEHRLGIEVSLTGRLRRWIDGALIKHIREWERARYEAFLVAAKISSKLLRREGANDIWQEKSPGDWWDALPSSSNPKLVRRTVDDDARQREVAQARTEADAERNQARSNIS